MRSKGPYPHGKAVCVFGNQGTGIKKNCYKRGCQRTSTAALACPNKMYLSCDSSNAFLTLSQQPVTLVNVISLPVPVTSCDSSIRNLGVCCDQAQEATNNDTNLTEVLAFWYFTKKKVLFFSTGVYLDTLLFIL